MADEQLRQQQMKETKPVAKHMKSDNKIHSNKIEKKDKELENKTDKKLEESKTEVKDDKKEEKKTEEKTTEKKVDKKKPIVKKDHAIVYGRSLPVSLKHAKAIGNFIKNKKIDVAIRELEQVMKKRLAIPFSGELAHRKGSIMSGKYPVKASNNFILLLKSLNANCTNNGMELDKTIIKEIVPNKAPDQLHRFGSRKFKRTHVKIKAMEIR